MKKFIAILLICAILLAGCSANADKSEIAEISPIADADSEEMREVTLYFGNADVDMLVGETREIHVPVNERNDLLKRCHASDPKQPWQALLPE